MQESLYVIAYLAAATAFGLTGGVMTRYFHQLGYQKRFRKGVLLEYVASILLLSALVTLMASIERSDGVDEADEWTGIVLMVLSYFAAVWPKHTQGKKSGSDHSFR